MFCVCWVILATAALTAKLVFAAEPQSRLTVTHLAMAQPPGDTASEPPKLVDYPQRGEPFTGRHKVVIEHDPAMPMYTIYRPERLGPLKHPVIAFGEGGCVKNGMMFPEFLSELASHGVVILADGPPGEPMTTRPAPLPEGVESPPRHPIGARPGNLGDGGAALTRAIDWIFAQNDAVGSRFFRKINTRRVAVMGMSCGALMAYGAAADPRVTTVGIFNSGLFSRDQKVYDSLHAPMLFLSGGAVDVAYRNMQADFDAIDKKNVPMVYGEYPAAHRGTYGHDNGGEYGVAAVAWVKWQLFDDQGENGKGYFVGPGAKLAKRDKWVVKKKNLD